MAEKSRFFTSSGGDRKYIAEDINEALNWLFEEKAGVIASLGEALAVSSGGGYVSTVGTGVAVKSGAVYTNTTPLSLVHAAVAGGNSRYDRIVLRLDAALRLVHIVVIEGVAGVNPVAPSAVPETDILLSLVLADNSTGTPVLTYADERQYRPAIYIADTNLDAIADGSTYKKTTSAGGTAANAIGAATGASTAAKILSLLLGVDGAASGLDADLLDGQHAAAFAAALHAHDEAYAPLSHANRHAVGGADAIPEATTGAPGQMSAADKTKLNGIAASATKNEKASSSDLTTGSDDEKYATAIGLKNSNYGIRILEFKLLDDATVLTAGDGKLIWCVPQIFNGWNIVSVAAFVTTVSSSGLPTFQIRNVTDAVDILSTKVSIDANEFTSYTAATAAVIDAAKDDLATGDLIAFDCDVAGTGAKGAGIILGVQKP